MRKEIRILRNTMSTLLVIASGWLLRMLKLEYTVRYATERREERKLLLCTWT